MSHSAEPVKHSHITYRAYVDGLRAIAVLVVLFFHANLGLSGGFVGVDIFFVISGYLITGLILKDLDKGQFHITEFWERRVLRIMPALAVVILATLVAGWLVFFPTSFKVFGETLSAQAVIGANIYFWRQSGYFAHAMQENPLLHTWSLAVEEQFYLFFPFMLVVIKRISRQALLPAIILTGIGSLGLSIYWSYSHPEANFYLLPTRAWELLIGSFLAVRPPAQISRRWLTELLNWIGFAGVFYAVFFYDRFTRFPGLSATLPCVGAGLIIWANSRNLTSGGKLLATRPVVFIGLISYSLYLWHWPVLVFARYCTVDGNQWWSRPTVLLLISLVLAILSWKFVETPFRKRLVLNRRSRIFAFAGVTTAVFLSAGLAINGLKGMPTRFPADVLQYADGTKGRAFIYDSSVKEVQNGELVGLGVKDEQQPIDLFVWGDSHAMSVMSILDTLAKEHSVRGVAATHSGTAPLIGYESPWEPCKAFNRAVVDYLRNRHVKNLVIAVNWEYYWIRDDGKLDQLNHCLLDTLDALKDSGVKIWIVRQIPHQHWDVPRALAYTVYHGGDPQKIGLSLTEQHEVIRLQEPIFDGVAAKFPGVTILDPTPAFANTNNVCSVAKNGEALYFDDNHLSIAGAALLRSMFEPIFAGPANETPHAATKMTTSKIVDGSSRSTDATP